MPSSSEDRYFWSCATPKCIPLPRSMIVKLFFFLPSVWYTGSASYPQKAPSPTPSTPREKLGVLRWEVTAFMFILILACFSTIVCISAVPLPSFSDQFDLRFGKKLYPKLCRYEALATLLTMITIREPNFLYLSINFPSFLRVIWGLIQIKYPHSIKLHSV